MLPTTSLGEEIIFSAKNFSVICSGGVPYGAYISIWIGRSLSLEYIKGPTTVQGKPPLPHPKGGKAIESIPSSL